jgi:hypothetical protein
MTSKEKDALSMNTREAIMYADLLLKLHDVLCWFNRRLLSVVDWITALSTSLRSRAREQIDIVRKEFDETEARICQLQEEREELERKVNDHG